MSTRSSMAIMYKDGTVEGHYCHSDGYLSYNGEMLYDHYKNPEKVKKLIALGDMSSLNEEVEPPEGECHSYDSRVSGVSVFYKRDRNEKNCDSQKYPTIQDYLENGNFQEYDYVFNEKKEKWYLINHDTKKLVLLSSLLLKDPQVSESTKNSIREKMTIKKELAAIKKAVPVNKNKSKVKVF